LYSGYLSQEGKRKKTAALNFVTALNRLFNCVQTLFIMSL